MSSVGDCKKEEYIESVRNKWSSVMQS
jgi:hypothetical protein